MYHLQYERARANSSDSSILSREDIASMVPTCNPRWPASPGPTAACYTSVLPVCPISSVTICKHALQTTGKPFSKTADAVSNVYGPTHWLEIATMFLRFYYTVDVLISYSRPGFAVNNNSSPIRVDVKIHRRSTFSVPTNTQGLAMIGHTCVKRALLVARTNCRDSEEQQA